MQEKCKKILTDLIEQAKLEQHQRHLELMRDLKNVKPEE